MPRQSVRRYLSLQRFPVALLLLSLFKQPPVFLDAAHSDGGNSKFIVSSGRLAGIFFIGRAVLRLSRCAVPCLSCARLMASASYIYYSRRLALLILSAVVCLRQQNSITMHETL